MTEHEDGTHSTEERHDHPPERHRGDSAGPPTDNKTSFGTGPVWRSTAAGAPPPATADLERYASLIKELADGQETLLASVEERGKAIITLSGTLVTLMLAFTTIVTRIQTYRPPAAAITLLAAATVAFLVSAATAIGTYAPRRVHALNPETVRRELWRRWDHPHDAPIEKTTATRLALWTSAHKLTARKTRYLLGAVTAQVIAIGLLAAAIVIILTTG